MEQLQKGMVVLVTAGKEKNSIFVVIEKLHPGRVLIADGRHRKLAKPKAKSPRHLQVIGSLAAVPTRDRLVWESLTPFMGK